MEKKKNKNSDTSKLLRAGTTVAGLGSAAWLTAAGIKKAKSPKFYHVLAENQLPLHQYNSGKLIDKVKHRFNWGDIKTISSTKAKELQKNKTKDTFYFDVNSDILKGKEGLTGINADRKLHEFLEDKLNYNKLKSLNKHAPKTDKAIVGTENKIIKPRYGARGEGTFLDTKDKGAGSKKISPFQEVIDIVRRAPKKRVKSPSTKINEISSNPGNFVMQDKVNLSKEYRVNSLDGEIVSTHWRHNPSSPASKESWDSIRKMVKEVDNDLKSTLGLKNKTYLGYDIGVDDKGKAHILDINTQEGYFWRNPSKLKNKVIDSPDLKKPLIASGVTLTAAAKLNKKSKEEES